VIGELLFDEATIAARIASLGAAISRDYAGRTPVLIGLLGAAMPFLADLSRALTIPCEIDVIGVTAIDQSERIAFETELAVEIAGRDAIVVDDTVDTGMTLHFVVGALRARGPASLAVCALLDRPHRRIADIAIGYRGFEIPDTYVVGYGLDYLGRYRELPALYAHGAWPA
jgi:hypoxanthine phosphoribosyltransferase